MKLKDLIKQLETLNKCYDDIDVNFLYDSGCYSEIENIRIEERNKLTVIIEIQTI